MSLEQYKITTYEDNVKDLPDYPSDAGITAKMLKGIFDGRTDEEVKKKFNALIDALILTLDEMREGIENGNVYTDAEIEAHNEAGDSHGDIRRTITTLAERLNAVANSDDITLDQLSEIVEYIKDNREIIEIITTEKADTEDVMELNSRLDAEIEERETHINDFENPHNVTAEQVGTYAKGEVFTKAETMTEIEVYVSNELGVIYGDFDSHTANEENPHNVTAEQVGAYTKGEIDNFRIEDEMHMEQHVGMRIDEALGDISAALDELHAYAMALSGGDAE
jgi:hypothetical protein